MKKALYVLLMLGWIPTLAVVTGARWMSGESVSAQGNTPVKVTRLYTGSDGKTKVEELTNSADASGQRERCIRLGCPHESAGAANEPELFLDWHPASRRQLVVTLTGESEIELEGGRKIPTDTGPHPARRRHHWPGTHLARHRIEGQDHTRHWAGRRSCAATVASALKVAQSAPLLSRRRGGRRPGWCGQAIPVPFLFPAARSGLNSAPAQDSRSGSVLESHFHAARALQVRNQIGGEG